MYTFYFHSTGDITLLVIYVSLIGMVEAREVAANAELLKCHVHHCYDSQGSNFYCNFQSNCNGSDQTDVLSLHEICKARLNIDEVPAIAGAGAGIFVELSQHQVNLRCVDL